MARKRLGELLLEMGLLSESSLRAALAEQKRFGGTLGRVLIEMKYIGEEQLVSALSRQLNMPPVDLDAIEIPQAVLDWVPGDYAQQHSCVPFAQPMKFLDVAMVDPTNTSIIDELRMKTKLNVRSYLTGPKMLERALTRFYQRGFSFARTRTAGDSDFQIEHEAPRRNESSAAINLDGGTPVFGANYSGAVSASAAAADGIRPYPRTQTSRMSAVMPAAAQALANAATSEELTALKRQVDELTGLSARITSLEISLSSVNGIESMLDQVRDMTQQLAHLSQRLGSVEALVARDEDVLRKVLAILVEKGVTSREELRERLA